MNYSVTDVSLESLGSLFNDSKQKLNWSSVFITPVWLQAWWQVFGEGWQLYVREVRDGDTVIGVAPLMVRENTACFIGGTDVCDYQDFIIVPGMENQFFTVLLDDLKSKRIRQLELKHIRTDSSVYIHMADIARERGCGVECTAEEVSVEMELPGTWEEYLQILNTKQRHEVKRKLRRLTEAGEINYQWANNIGVVPGFMDVFFKMFTESRADKAEFLTEQREYFFRSIVDKLSEAGFLKLGVLELDGREMASIICFDYNNTIYLYNSGYDPEYNYLSVGLLSKVICIEKSIETGKEKFDFLKGAEPYKYHLGGQEIPLYRCEINIT
jgi:CelD/BcsL family acetyltransferase involved in cellulose biosynthesis